MQNLMDILRTSAKMLSTAAKAFLEVLKNVLKNALK